MLDLIIKKIESCNDLSSEDKIKSFKKEELDIIFNDYDLIFKLLVNMISRFDSESMYRMRGLILLNPLLKNLSIVADRYNYKPSPSFIKQNLNLESIIAIYQINKKEHCAIELREKIIEIPDLKINSPFECQSFTTQEQTGYLVMHLEHVLNEIIHYHNYEDDAIGISLKIIMNKKLSDF
jgi:hypothetical protein